MLAMVLVCVRARIIFGRLVMLLILVADAAQLDPEV